MIINSNRHTKISNSKILTRTDITTIKWVVAAARIVFPAVTPIFAWIACSAFVAVVDNLFRV